VTGRDLRLLAAAALAWLLLVAYVLAVLLLLFIVVGLVVYWILRWLGVPVDAAEPASIIAGILVAAGAVMAWLTERERRR
jgi:uncharacterized membrane protein required for colicin V production